MCSMNMIKFTPYWIGQWGVAVRRGVSATPKTAETLAFLEQPLGLFSVLISRGPKDGLDQLRFCRRQLNSRELGSPTMDGTRVHAVRFCNRMNWSRIQTIAALYRSKIVHGILP